MRLVLDLNLPLSVALAALALVAVVSAVLVQISTALMPAEGNLIFADLLASPFKTALLEAGQLSLTAWLIHVVGRARGGHGTLEQSVMAVVWLQALMIVLQLAEILAIALHLPELALLVMLISISGFFWLLTMFVAEVHGFPNPVAVFFGILLTSFLVALGIGFLLVGLLGPEAFQNV